MNKELIRELIDANYPFTFHDDSVICLPSLSELIEACGDEFLELGKYKQTHIKRGKFWAFIHMDWYKKPIKWWKAGSTNKLGWQWRFRGEGSTPEEAVARLWLAMHK